MIILVHNKELGNTKKSFWNYIEFELQYELQWITILIIKITLEFKLFLHSKCEWWI